MIRNRANVAAMPAEAPKSPARGVEIVRYRSHFRGRLQWETLWEDPGKALPRDRPHAVGANRLRCALARTHLVHHFRLGRQNSVRDGQATSPVPETRGARRPRETADGRSARG